MFSGFAYKQLYTQCVVIDQSVIVQSFDTIFLQGMFGDIEIGRANANDPDDWDYIDKHYTMINPNGMDQFFK